MSGWNQLETVKFQQKLKPAAIEIYKMVFKGCMIEDLRLDGVKVHPLDQAFGIDSLINLPSGQALSLQEKYRDNYWSRKPEITQEYKNAAGTQYENEGEWFHLSAQLYFVGWADKAVTHFVKWCIFDITKYKMKVEKVGGLSHIPGAFLKKNKKHGKASFYVIPIKFIEDCMIDDYRKYLSYNGQFTQQAA